jgi:hypothetical protein
MVLLSHIMALAFLGIPRNEVGVSGTQPVPREGMHTHSDTNKKVASKL